MEKIYLTSTSGVFVWYDNDARYEQEWEYDPVSGETIVSHDIFVEYY